MRTGMRHISRSDFERADMGLVETLETFFSVVDSGTLFNKKDPLYFQNLRNEIAEAFFQLLVWKRPFLEAAKGIHWPYAALQRRVAYVEEMARQNSRPFIREQAMAFLARLPFPGQWHWLIEAERRLKETPEFKDFFLIEKNTIQRKLAKKKQKTFNLHHFCQILKRPNLPHEKGILRIFSLPYLFADKELLQSLSRHFLLHVEPGAGVIYRHAWYRAFSKLEVPCIFGAAGKEDADFLNTQPKIITTRLAHADFLENEPIVALEKKKEFDIVFNGTYDEMLRKRHEHLLSLLQHPRLKHATALFLGRGKDANIQAFKRSVAKKGLSERVTVLSNLQRKEIPSHLARCRLGIHLALHENGCRSIYEFFRSDLPCVVSTCTAGVNFNIFNSQTGIAAPDRDLADAISSALRNRNQFAPRSWFLSQSGSTNASRELNQQFKKIFENLGYEWTEDIVPLGSSGANRYVTTAHYERFRTDFKMLFEIFNKIDRLPIKLSLD